MDPLLICYLYVTSMDPLMLCYLLNAFACVVVCFFTWVYLTSKYKREHAHLVLLNGLNEFLVETYQKREMCTDKHHHEFVEILRQVKDEIAKETEDRLCGIIKSLKSELGDLRHDRDKLLLDWADQVKHAKVHAWVPELLPTSQAGSP
jgi:hypothetical protein